MTCCEGASSNTDLNTYMPKHDLSGSEKYQFNGVVIDPAADAVTVNDEQRHIGSGALEVLVYLIDNRGRLVEKPELFDQIWTPEPSPRPRLNR